MHSTASPSTAATMYRCVRVARNRNRKTKKKIAADAMQSCSISNNSDERFLLNIQNVYIQRHIHTHTRRQINQFQFLFEASSLFFSVFFCFLFGLFSMRRDVISERERRIDRARWMMAYEAKHKIDVNVVAFTTHKHSNCCWCRLLVLFHCVCVCVFGFVVNCVGHTFACRTHTDNQQKCVLRMADCYYCLFFFTFFFFFLNS